jgi:predicted nucleic acid-binding protein
MFDTMEYDKLLENQATYEKLLHLITYRRIELLTTHIQRDEIMATPDEAKRTKLMRLFTTAHLIATRGIIFGTSRFGEARFGRDEDHKVIDDIRGNSWDKDTEDSLIAATASSDADTLVTDDRPFMRRLRDANVRCDVIDFGVFQRRLECL